MNLLLPIRLLLWPISVVYGVAAQIRAWLYKNGWLKQRRLRAKVVSVGNLTVGGTGKTPMVLWLAERLLAEGKRVGILSRGYRGGNSSSDEIELMKMRLGGRAVFGVGADRYEEGRRIEARQAVDVFLLDDGFQHLQLARDADVVLVDSSRPLHKEWLLPSGRLREHRKALLRADLVVFTRAEMQEKVVTRIEQFPELPFYPTRTRLVGFRRVDKDRTTPGPLAEKLREPAFVFCGIGNPQAFLKNLACWEVHFVGNRLFRDHHPYSEAELRHIEQLAQAAGATVLVTTEKDVQNLHSVTALRMPLYYCEITMELEDEKQFLAALERKLHRAQGVLA